MPDGHTEQRPMQYLLAAFSAGSVARYAGVSRRAVPSNLSPSLRAAWLRGHDYRPAPIRRIPHG